MIDSLLGRPFYSVHTEYLALAWPVIAAYDNRETRDWSVRQLLADK